MKTESYIIDESAMSTLAGTVGKELKSYCSDMECSSRAFGVVVLRFGDFDLEMRISEIENESEIDWIKDNSKVGVVKTSLEKVEASAGQIDKYGNYVPNPFVTHPVGNRVKHVSIITEKTCRDMGSGEGEVCTSTRGIVIDFGDSFIAFDKVESWGEVWTITAGGTEAYIPDFMEKDDEAPEFTTSVEVTRIA